MKPGRELDALIAERVMGGRKIDDPGKPFGLGGAPHYSTDIAAAWEVVERLCELWPETTISHDKPINEWFVSSEPEIGPTTVGASGDTAPHAIALAALKAVGNE